MSSPASRKLLADVKQRKGYMELTFERLSETRLYAEAGGE